jgi:hypothetical protein
MIENDLENNIKQPLINNVDSSKEISSFQSQTISNTLNSKTFTNSKFSNSNFTNNSNINYSITKIKYQKSTRYKIGISFFILYILLNALDTIFISYFDYDFKINVFGEIYLRMSSLFIFIFLSIFFPKITKKITLFNLMKYYIPDWKNNMNFEVDHLNTNFYIHEGTIEKFYKIIHKISFLFMFLLYFSISFYTKSYSDGIQDKNNKQIFIISLSFPLGLIMIVILLRKIFLFSKKFDKLSKISIILLLLGIIPLFIYEYENFDDYHHYIEIFFYAFIGGICYGFYSTFLKFFSNVYGKNFKIEKVLGYIGIYTFICMPFFLCLILWWNSNKDTIHMFEQGNNKLCYSFLFIINVLNYITQIHCIISLSPFIFGFATFVSVLINFTIHIILGSIKADIFFGLGFILISLGTFVGLFDKYLKQRNKNKLQ